METARAKGFRHEAFFYGDLDEYAAHTAAFVRAGLESGEPVLVAVPPEKVARIRDALGSSARAAEFRDMTKVGLNPLRIIPMWRDFVAVHAAEGRRVRGIGEPVWATRSAEELVEALRHEALINVAFHRATATILCPYDTAALAEAVLTEARRSHPVLVRQGSAVGSDAFVGVEAIARPFDLPLPEPPSPATRVEFGSLDDLALIRELVASFAMRRGLDPSRIQDLVLSVNEVATNSLRHGGKAGTFRMWADHASVVAEVCDAGRADAPLIGRASRPENPAAGGFGLWIVNQLCDLVQIRSLPSGTAVRLHMNVTRGRIAN